MGGRPPPQLLQLQGSAQQRIKEHQLGLGTMATMPAIITTASAGLSWLQPVRQRDLAGRELPPATANSTDIFRLHHRSFRSSLTVDNRERNIQP
jgi:hypothetical protein